MYVQCMYMHIHKETSNILYVYEYETHSESVVNSAEALQLWDYNSVKRSTTLNIFQFGQVVWCVDLYTHYMEFLWQIKNSLTLCACISYHICTILYVSTCIKCHFNTYTCIHEQVNTLVAELLLYNWYVP